MSLLVRPPACSDSNAVPTRVALDKLLRAGAAQQIPFLVVGRNLREIATVHASVDVESTTGMPWMMLMEKDRDRFISRIHGVFTMSASRVVRFMDLGSSRGSLFLPSGGDVQRIQPGEPLRLKNGDAIAVGRIPDSLQKQDIASDMHTFTYYVAPTGAVLSDELAAVPSKEQSELGEVLESCACPVCQELPIASRALPCGHVMCVDCTMRWFVTSDTCPICRAVVDDATRKRKGSPCTQLDSIVETLMQLAGDTSSKLEAAQYASHSKIKELIGSNR